MSLLLEALKKAEKAKEEAQRRASAQPEAAEVSEAVGASGEHRTVLTRDKLPDVSTPLEIVSDDLTPSRSAASGSSLEPIEAAAPLNAPSPASQATAAPRRGVPSSDEAGRATAKKVFEAKFREPNPRMPFYITVGVLGLFAVGTVVYFWYQLRPPPSLVNVNPPRAVESAAAAATAAPVVASAPVSATREPTIPGLPGGPSMRSAPTTRSATPAVPASGPVPAARARPATAHAAPAEEPRLAPRLPVTPKAAPAQLPAKPIAQINPKVQAGYAAYLAGDLAAARANYEEVLREEPANRDALLGLAALDVRAARYEAAEALYLRLLQADPRDAEAQGALLALRAGRNDPLATESRVKSLLAADPDAPALNFTLGNQLAQQNRWAEAHQEYLKAYAAEPDNADFAYNVAVSFDHLHQSRQALEYYQRALALARQRGASFDLAAAQTRAAQLGR